MKYFTSQHNGNLHSNRPWLSIRTGDTCWKSSKKPVGTPRRGSTTYNCSTLPYNSLRRRGNPTIFPLNEALSGNRSTRHISLLRRKGLSSTVKMPLWSRQSPKLYGMCKVTSTIVIWVRDTCFTIIGFLRTCVNLPQRSRIVTIVSHMDFPLPHPNCVSSNHQHGLVVLSSQGRAGSYICALPPCHPQSPNLAD